MADLLVRETVTYDHTIRIKGVSTEDIDDFINFVELECCIYNSDDLLSLVYERFGKDNVELTWDNSGKCEDMEFESL